MTLTESIRELDTALAGVRQSVARHEAAGDHVTAGLMRRREAELLAHRDDLAATRTTGQCGCAACCASCCQPWLCVPCAGDGLQSSMLLLKSTATKKKAKHVF